MVIHVEILSRNLNLGIGMATTPIIYKGKIYIGISGAPGSSMGSGWTAVDNLIIGNTISGSGVLVIHFQLSLGDKFSKSLICL
jgi:hypothetical protein